MRPYSRDLRERVMRAVDDGQLTQREIAEQFGVSDRWIRQLTRHREQTGSLAPKPHGGGRSAQITGETLEQVQATLRAEPDATLEELRQRCGITASVVCLFRTLRRHQITRKKSRCTPASRTRPPSRRSGRRGGGSRRG